MNVFREHIVGCQQSHYYYFGFNKFADRCPDFTFIEAPVDFAKVGREWVRSRKVVYLELEEPNRFFVRDWFTHLGYDELFHRVFSICPYTTKWLNARHGNRETVFIPFDANNIPPVSPKDYDVLYAGHIFPGEITNLVDNITGFNYRLVSNTADRRVTDHGNSFSEKLGLMARTKITLVHNLLFPNNFHISNVMANDGYTNNEAFSRMHSDRLVPQIKGRTFEAAFCRSLILCRRDPFNIITRYFEPDKEFVYFEPGRLREKIAEILANWDHFRRVAGNAYDRAVAEYTTERFVDRFLCNLA